VIIVSFVFQLFPSASAAEIQRPSACAVINNALNELYPSFADSVNIAGRQANCIAKKQKGQWICTVYQEERCTLSETENSKESHTQTPFKDNSQLLDIYNQTTQEATFCLAQKIPLPLKYTKFNSQEDAYASKGSQFTADSGLKGLYVMLRVHAFMKDKKICRKGMVSLEIQKLQDFEHF
jgi:hypothetical protein